MRVLELKNYGPFREARLELAKLTVLIGRNSTGKSLLAYTYVILSRALNPFNILAFGGSEALKNLDEYVRRYLEHAFTRFVGRSPRDLIHVGQQEACISFRSLLGRIVVVMTRDDGIRSVVVEHEGELRKALEAFASMMEEMVIAKSRNPYEVLLKMAIDLGIAEVVEAYYAPIVLVDSRSGIIKMVSKLQAYATLMALQRLDPDLELVLHLNTLSSTLEMGHVNLETAKPLLAELGVREVKSVGQEILVSPVVGPLYTLASAPSGMREALPLALVLSATSFREVVIEEPEAHLHPAAVKAFARVLARAVNQGKSVLVTTHSDVLLSAVNNLIMLHSRPEKARRLGYADKDLLDPKNVTAYATRVRNGYVELEKLSVDETGIPEDEYAQVIREIADERAEALS